MSESSLSSIEFIRSVTSLTREDSRTQNPDVDELFSFDDARRTLASKLSRPTSELAVGRPSELQPESSSFVGSTSIPSVQLPLTFAPWRVFLNCVDSFNSKYIARFLSGQVFGSSKNQAGEEDTTGAAAAEVLGEEEDEPVTETTKKEVQKFKYEIIGSLLEPDGKYEKKYVSEIVNTSDREILLDVVNNCGFIVYDISRYVSQADEAQYVLNSIERHLSRIEKDTPKAFKELKDVPSFILISSFMNWAQTKPVDPDEPDLPFREMDYKKRKCHPNFKRNFLLEKEVVAAGKKWPDKFRTIVVCSGVQYGYEENILNHLFKLAWENHPELPLYLPGKNVIPLIHVQDLATMIFHILELFPAQKYVLAVEKNMSTVKSITKAISRGLSTGDVVKLPKEDMFLLKYVSQYIYDCMTANVRMEPAYFVEQVSMNWTTDASFAFNMTNVIHEYRQSRGLQPIRILIAGPPAVGKTVLARKLCAFYQLHYLGRESFAEVVTQRLRYKIERIKAKEQAALEKQLEKGETEGESDEDEEEEEAEEYEESVEEEEERESLDELTEALEELLQNMEENEGQLDDEHLVRCAKEVLNSPPFHNQGYVLDGYPETIDQVKLVLDSPDAYLEEEIEGEDGSPPVPPFYPDYVVGLDASNEYIVERVIELSEEEIQEKHYAEDDFMRRLTTYRSQNTDDTGILSYMDEKGVHPIVISVEEDKSPLLEETFRKLVNQIGTPHNFGQTKEDILEAQRLEEDAKHQLRALELARQQDVEKQAHLERMQKLSQWVEAMDRIKDAEEEAFAADSLALRNYLMKYIFPTLSRGLVDVAQKKPTDPIDYLAEYLFKANPEGKMFDTDSNTHARKMFEEMMKKRDSRLSLDGQKPVEDRDQEFQDKDGRGWYFVADSPYDTYY